MGKILTEKEEQQLEEELNNIYTEEWHLAGEPEEEDYEKYIEAYDNDLERQLDNLEKDRKRIEERRYESSYYANYAKLKRNLEYGDKNIGKVLIDDFPTHDLLQREKQAFQLAEYIRNESVNSFFNIGIVGEWGTGKSTFLDFIKKDLEEDSSNIIKISYDASAYSDKNQIWSNFAKILFEKFEDEQMFAHIRYIFSKMKIHKKRIVSQVILNIVVFSIAFLCIIGGKFSFSFNALLGKFAGYGVSLVGILLIITQIVIPWGKSMLSITIPLSKRIENEMKFPSYLEKLGTRESVTRDLNVLFKTWIPKENQKIVIFVDELDRCSDKGISEFFQAIQLFYETKKIIFVFAIEYSHLKRALIKNFNLKGNQIEIGIEKYLDKYISIMFSIDNRIDFSQLAENLIKEISEEGKLQIEDAEIQQIKKCFRAIPYRHLTPRKIKKIINLLVLLKRYCIKCYANEKIDFDKFFTWIIFSNCYHDTARYITKTKVMSEKREFTPLEKILQEDLKYSKLLGKIKTTGYADLIKDFSLHEIKVYDKISNGFSVLIS